MKQEDFELLERYILDQMERDEKQEFEQRLARDPELASQCHQLRDQIMAIGYINLKEKLNSFQVPMETKPEGEESGQNVNTHEIEKRYRLKPWIGVAATIILLVSILYFATDLWYKPGADLEKIFYQDPGLPTPMSETDRYRFFDAMVDYKAGKYEVALEKWNQTEELGQDTLTYYKGMALMGLGENHEALARLAEVPPTSSLGDKAKWYRVYILIQLDRYEEAYHLISSIPDSIEGYDDVLDYLKQNR